MVATGKKIKGQTPRPAEGALRELLGEEHRRCHASECEAGQQVARRAGGTDAVHDGERPAERGERRQANISGSVHEHHVGCELRRAERLPQGPGARETGVADGELPDTQAAGLKPRHERLVGDHRRRGVAAAGEPATEDGEDGARAPPGPTRRQQGHPQRASGYRGHRLFARSMSG